MQGDKEPPPTAMTYTEILAHRAKREVTHQMFAKSQSSDDARAFLGHHSSGGSSGGGATTALSTSSGLGPTTTTSSTSANVLAQYQKNRFYIGSYAERSPLDNNSNASSRHKFMPATSPRHVSAPSKHVTVNAKPNRDRKGLTHRSKTSSGDHPSRTSKESNAMGLGQSGMANNNEGGEETTSRINTQETRKRMSKKSSNH
jgi:hypothetical protein